MSTAFANAFKKKAGKVFDKAKSFKHRSGNSFGPAPVPDGTFTAVVTMEANVPTKGKMEGIPVVRVKAAIDAGPYKGLEPSQSYFCEGKPPATSDDELPTAEQQLLGLLGHLLPDIQIESDDQVPQAIDLVNERGPRVEIGIRNKENGDKKYQNVYFNKVLEAQTFESGAASEGAQQETSKAADADSDSPDYEPAKGDMVTLEGSDSEWEVKQVSQSRKTANLEDGDGNRQNGIEWAKLSLL